MNDVLPLSEDFVSIQGEGAGSGLPTYFIRVAGCNLAEKYNGCIYCDTGYAQHTSQAKEWISLPKLLERIPSYPGRVCITGGEPLAHPAMPAFLSMLAPLGRVEISVETNGSIELPLELCGRHLSTLSWAVDIKCPSSGMAAHNFYGNIYRLRPFDQLKFIIGDKEDYDFAKSILAEHRECRVSVVFQPIWRTMNPATLVQWVLKDELQVRVSLQSHKFIWGTRRGV